MPFRGISLDAQCRALRDGVRFRNIGSNYGAGICRLYSQPSATACAYTPLAEQRAMLDLAVSMKQKILRTKAGPYWPAQWRYGVNNGVAGVPTNPANWEPHLQKIDAYLDELEARDQQVILVVAFRLATITDLASETMRDLLNTGSQSWAYLVAWTQALVTRNLGRAGVAGYELTNEQNHYNDASDATLTADVNGTPTVGGRFPGVSTANGTRASYSAATDVFSGDELALIMSRWAAVVNAIDTQRLTGSGNGPNSYSRPGGAPGIVTPLRFWFAEQMRDSPPPLRWVGLHYYMNIGYGSANGEGLGTLLTGTKHYARERGQGSYVGELGNQPWKLASLNGNGTTLTIGTDPGDSGCPVKVGDEIQLAGPISPFDGLKLTLNGVSADRKTLTAACTVVGSWAVGGTAVKGLQHMSGAKLARRCQDVIGSGTDIALVWQIDSDPLTPIWESLSYPGNEAQRAAVLAANTSLGW